MEESGSGGDHPPESGRDGGLTVFVRISKVSPKGTYLGSSSLKPFNQTVNQWINKSTFIHLSIYQSVYLSFLLIQLFYTTGSVFTNRLKSSTIINPVWSEKGAEVYFVCPNPRLFHPDEALRAV